MIDLTRLKELCDKLGCRMITECPLSEYITFKFGGPCRALVSVNAAKSASELVKFLRTEGIRFGVLGRGSNVLAADEGFDGVILLFGSDHAGISIEGNRITCKSGALLASACVHAQQSGLTGMERLFGIPGTVGGALYMNAGAYLSEMKDIVVSAEYIDEQGNICTMNAEDMKLSYRHSIFAEKDYIITAVTMELQNGDPDEIKATMSEYMHKRSDKQPLDYPSAGSTFKRPEKGYASALIDQCGLKGMSVGGAQVSEKHAGFVINTGAATCNDVIQLCDKVKAVVKEKTGITLELEPVVLK